MISNNYKIVTLYSSLTARSFINEVKKLDLITFAKTKYLLSLVKMLKRN